MTKPGFIEKRARMHRSPTVQRLLDKMENDPWYVKLKRWWRLKVWVYTCLTRKYWDKSFESYIFKRRSDMKTITIDGVEYGLTPIKKTKKKQEPIILEQNLKFEVYHKNLGEYNWKDAKKVCEDLGEGWRLPTREELHFMWLNRNTISDFATTYYWSSSENYNDYAWSQHFNLGFQGDYLKGNTYYVRPVRTVKE